MTIMPVETQAVCKPGQCTMPAVYFLPSMRLSLDRGSVAQICLHVPRKSGKNTLKRQEGAH